MRYIIFLLTLSVGLLSCQKDDGVSPTNDSMSSAQEFFRSADGLKITEFTEEGVNKTNTFNPYLFLFNEDGTVTATKTGESISGTYLIFLDDNRTELRMTFANNSNLNELTDDWYFVEINGNTIRFEDSGDVVQFQKQ